MPEIGSPAIQQRRLRVELRRAREAQAETQEDVAASLDWSLSKLIRIEKGVVGISTTDLRALLQHYKIESGRIEQLVSLAKTSRVQAWWTPYKRLISKDFLDFLGYENAASEIRQAEPIVIPGILQTPDYSTALAHETSGPAILAEIESYIEIRLKRQEVLDLDGRRFHFAIDEAAVRRLVGGPQVMRPQLVRLLELGERPNIDIDIIPFSAGAHRAMLGPFAILEFPDPEDDDVLYLENSQGSKLRRDANEEIVDYRDSFERLRSQSLQGEEGPALLRRLLGEL